MNTTEKIVESYFRYCRQCFTFPDIKVIDGNNRQIDLLAYDLKTKQQFHVETSVTHCVNWCPDAEELIDNFERKFFGKPPERKGVNTDFSKDKKYDKQIFETYETYGFDPKRIQRIWVCWTVHEPEKTRNEIDKYCRIRKIHNNPIRIITFLNEIIPELSKKIGSSNYEDDVLRLLSLFRAYEEQRKSK